MSSLLSVLSIIIIMVVIINIIIIISFIYLIYAAMYIDNSNLVPLDRVKFFIAGRFANCVGTWSPPLVTVTTNPCHRFDAGLAALVPSNLWYKSHFMPKRKCFSSCVAIVFAQSIEAKY